MSSLRIPNVSNIVSRTLATNHGILFLEPTVVYRATFTGNNIVGKNSIGNSNTSSTIDYDSRGYVPVENWVCSCTQALNPSFIENEGISRVQLKDETNSNTPSILLTDIINDSQSKSLLFGEKLNMYTHWPLIKILDIGGKPTQLFAKENINNNNNNDSITNYDDISWEQPPIPCHVHPIKREAYFFPTMPDFAQNTKDGKQSCYDDDDCHNTFSTSETATGDDSDEILNEKQLKLVSRLGVNPKTNKQDFINDINTGWGKNHNIYSYLNEFEITTNSGWYIPNKIIHSPGPALTLEIQTPHDDYHLLSWQIGQFFDNDERNEYLRKETMKEHCLKEAKGVESLFDDIDWENSTCSDFRQKYERLPRMIEQGDWGSIQQIFFDIFYCEMVIIESGCKYDYNKVKHYSNDALSGLVWNGTGTIGDVKNDISAVNPLKREFIVCRDVNSFEIVNTSDHNQLQMFIFYPLNLE